MAAMCTTGEGLPTVIYHEPGSVVGNFYPQELIFDRLMDRFTTMQLEVMAEVCSGD